MKLTTKTIQEVTFDESEVKLLKDCLKYCLHRICYHDESGINKIISPKDGDRLAEWVKELK